MNVVFFYFIFIFSTDIYIFHLPVFFSELLYSCTLNACLDKSYIILFNNEKLNNNEWIKYELITTRVINAFLLVSEVTTCRSFTHVLTSSDLMWLKLTQCFHRTGPVSWSYTEEADEQTKYKHFSIYWQLLKHMTQSKRQGLCRVPGSTVGPGSTHVSAASHRPRGGGGWPCRDRPDMVLSALAGQSCSSGTLQVTHRGELTAHFLPR